MATGNPTTEAQQAYDNFWPKESDQNKKNVHCRHQAPELQVVRINKIMKLDEDVKMISAGYPVLFAKAAEMFIHKFTIRTWIHTEVNISCQKLP